MPERRKNAPELILLKPGQLERIEAIVTTAFGIAATQPISHQ